MAGDWIKMRVDLYRDPKVCAMADQLLALDGDLARHIDQNMQREMCVTRNVMRNSVVGALLSVWGVMRTRGKRQDDDLLCRGVSVSVLDDIADLPGFGDAMLAVGWVSENEQGIVFERFFEDYNTDPAETSRLKNAARQQAYRDRKKAEKRNVTDNVTVTHREEKRREEKSSSVVNTQTTTNVTRAGADPEGLDDDGGMDEHAPSPPPPPAAAPTPPAGHDGEASKPTPAGHVCLLMRKAGLADVNPSHPELQVLLAAGIPPETFQEAAKAAIGRSAGFAYALGIVKRQATDAARLAQTQLATPKSRPLTAAERQAARIAELTPGLAANPNPTTNPRDNPDIIDMEPSNAPRLTST